MWQSEVLMILHLVAIWLLTFAAPIPSQWNPQVLDWDKAANEIRRQPPSAFPELPAVIRGELDRKRCTIPQADGYPKPRNLMPRFSYQFGPQKGHVSILGGRIGTFRTEL